MSPINTSSDKVTFHRWADMPREKVTDQISRRLVTGQGMMLAHVFLADPEAQRALEDVGHQHHNEQLTYILEGALRFWIGEDESETIDVRAGEVLHIPSNVWHKAEALEDTLDVDVFNPPREDWLNHTDSYFHKK